MKQPQCSVCHRPLTDPFSIAVGMGPECRGALSKKGWKFPKPRYRVLHGHVILEAVVGKVEPPSPNVQTGKWANKQMDKKKEEGK